MTWQPGRGKISDLISDGELEQVEPSDDTTRRLLQDAARHLDTATVTLSSEDLSGAYQLAYDALRKSAASLLSVQGLRATSRGGHIAVQDAVLAQFGASVPAFRSFARIRRACDTFEYPSNTTPGTSTDDVDDAIASATAVYEAAQTVIKQNLLTRW